MTDKQNYTKIYGLGTDIGEIARLRRHLNEQGAPDPLILDVFSPEEIRCNLASSDPALRFALGFSCKEAVFKAVGRSWMSAPITWKDIELLFEPDLPDPGFRIRLADNVSEMVSALGGHEVRGRYANDAQLVTFDVLITD